MNQEEENRHINEVRNANDPSKLDQKTLHAIEMTVGLQAGVNTRSERAELTRRFLNESYRELLAAPTDKPHYDSDIKFFDAMLKDTLVRAQEYETNKMAELRLRPRDGRQQSDDTPYQGI